MQQHQTTVGAPTELGTWRALPAHRRGPHSPDDQDGRIPLSHDPDYVWCAECRIPIVAGRACPHISLTLSEAS